MASSSRKLFKLNILLVLLIGGMFWFMFTGGSTDFFKLISTGTTPAGTKLFPFNSPTISTQGPAAKDAEAIEALQKQLEAEQQRAASTRAQLQARTQSPSARTKNSEGQQFAPSTAPASTNPSPGGLNIEQQTQLVSQMIQAQIKGAKAENQRLKQALQTKDQEISAVKKRNSEFAGKLLKLDNSAQALLAKLVADGNTISDSDQDYLHAMQTLQNDTVNPDQSVNLSETDLINRVDISDSGDLGSIAAQLRTTVNGLMEENKKPKSR